MNPTPPRGHIALTFDDDFIENWHALQAIFEPFGARATYFVCRFEQLSGDQLSLLANMRDYGHEIGSHGLNHLSVQNDFNTDPARIPEYLEREILPSIKIMEEAGFRPRSFAYPYGHHNEAYDQALLPHFEQIRATAYKKRLRPPHWLKSIYHRAGSGQRLHHGLGIDVNYGLSDGQLDRALRKAQREQLTVCFYAHNPGEAGDDYIVRPQRLRFLCERAQALGMGFKTLSELV